MLAPRPSTHQSLAIEAELAHGSCRFVRERLRLPPGQEASFGWLRHPPSVLVVPQLEDGRLLLLRRWRPAVGQWVLEFPTGALDPGEGPAAGAARLVRDLTTGQGGGRWRLLGQLRPNPGYSDERMTLGLLALAACPGAGLAAGDSGEPEDGEPHQLQLFTPRALEDALSALAEPVDGRSVSAWLLASRWGGI